MTAEQPDEPAVSPGDLSGLETAAPAEAAAVAAAIGAHLRDRERAAAASAEVDDEADWSGKKWPYADRLARHRDRGVRIARGTPTDPWTAAGRTDRL